MSGKVKDYLTLVKWLFKLKTLKKEQVKEFMKKVWAVLYNRLITNWRTSLAGILTVVFGWLLYENVIPPDVFSVIVMILGFFGIPIKDPRGSKTVEEK